MTVECCIGVRLLLTSHQRLSNKTWLNLGTLLVVHLPAEAAIAARRELAKDSSLIREQDTPEMLIEPGTHPSLDIQEHGNGQSTFNSRNAHL